jgi:outer membrane receptor protein involved in Fe transport
MRIQSILRAAPVALFTIPAALRAQGNVPDSVRALRAVTITATRTPTRISAVPAPVSVVDSAAIRERQPNTAADLLRELPGVDVIGVGANQARPSIRGQRGQRILLLQDGIRLNNSRRQQDFGELPALVDVNGTERVEVVRGPSSVLYGSDAIGGVINLITRGPSFAGPNGVTGSASYRFGSAGDQSRSELLVRGHSDRFSFELSGAGRVAGNYDAPSGSFGKVTFAKQTTVLDGGVRDNNLRALLGWKGDRGAGAYLKVERYVADDAGFGYVPPSILGGDQTKIQILYPHQNVQKLTAGWQSGVLHSPVADKVDVMAYGSRNERDLVQHILVPAGPNATIGIDTRNFTDLGTVGGRVEAVKVLPKAILTYGLDAFRDQSANTDSSLTTVTGFGPTQKQASTRAQVPNASLASYGLFAQSDFHLHDRLNVIVGGRFQSVSSEPKATAGRTDDLSSHTNSTTVYAVNGRFRATDALSLIATVGRGFRWPNLVERYFDGPTPEGSAYQKASPDLKPETSVNYDLGAKFSAGRVCAEAFVFQNNISDGIQTLPTGAMQSGLPVYTNTNVGKLRTDGVELVASVTLDRGFTVGANYSTVKTKNVLNPAVPIGDTFASKLNGSLGWRSATGRVWGEYVVRRNGEQKDIAVGTSPVGPVLPAFTVQSVRGGLRGWQVGPLRQDLSIAINNIGNVLYAEAANSSFFRPEPGRTFVFSLATAF